MKVNMLVCGRVEWDVPEEDMNKAVKGWVGGYDWEDIKLPHISFTRPLLCPKSTEKLLCEVAKECIKPLIGSKVRVEGYRVFPSGGKQDERYLGLLFGGVCAEASQLFHERTKKWVGFHGKDVCVPHMSIARAKAVEGEVEMGVQLMPKGFLREGVLSEVMIEVGTLLYRI